MTRKQQKFIERYCKHCNASRAAREAGYSIRSAGQIGYENLRKPEIKGLIRQQLDRRSEEIKRILRAREDSALTRILAKNMKKVNKS